MKIAAAKGTQTAQPKRHNSRSKTQEQYTNQKIQTNNKQTNKKKRKERKKKEKRNRLWLRRCSDKKCAKLLAAQKSFSLFSDKEKSIYVKLVQKNLCKRETDLLTTSVEKVKLFADAIHFFAFINYHYFKGFNSISVEVKTIIIIINN